MKKEGPSFGTFFFLSSRSHFNIQIFACPPNLCLFLQGSARREMNFEVGGGDLLRCVYHSHTLNAVPCLPKHVESLPHLLSCLCFPCFLPNMATGCRVCSALRFFQCKYVAAHGQTRSCMQLEFMHFDCRLRNDVCISYIIHATHPFIKHFTVLS